MIKAAKITSHNKPKTLPGCSTLVSALFFSPRKSRLEVASPQPPEDVADLEVNPVDGVADILEHALVGHEEVAVFEASLAAAGVGGEERSRDTQEPSDGPQLYRGVSNAWHLGFVFLFAFIWDSLPLLERSPAKQESILPLKDQQPGFRGQRTCSHSRLHPQ